MSTIDRGEFGDYLRMRRAKMRPRSDDGERTSRRRVPGLRRQEIAERASVSVEYYTRLEQGRAPRPSREVLSSLARAFELSEAENAYLFRLVGEPAPERSTPAVDLRPGLTLLLDHLDAPMPATVHDARLDLLAWNDSATELFGLLDRDGRFGRNIVHHFFTDDATASMYDEAGAEEFGRLAAGELRSASARYPRDEYLDALITELSATSAKFRGHWESQQVGSWRSATKRLLHRTRGWCEFDCEALQDPERDHWVTLYAPRAPRHR